MKIIIAVVFVIFLCAVLGGIMDNKDKAKKVGVHLLKVVSLWVLISIVVLLCAAIQPSTIQAMAVMAIIACDVFGIPIYVAFCLVRNFTDGTLKKVMYAVWGGNGGTLCFSGGSYRCGDGKQRGGNKLYRTVWA